MDFSLGFCYRLWWSSWIINYLGKRTFFSISTSTHPGMPLSPGDPSYPFFLDCGVEADMLFFIFLIAKVKQSKLWRSRQINSSDSGMLRFCCKEQKEKGYKQVWGIFNIKFFIVISCVSKESVENVHSGVSMQL